MLALGAVWHLLGAVGLIDGAFCLHRPKTGARRFSGRLLPVSIVTEVLLPASVPSIIAGLRISAGIRWQSRIGVELIVLASRIGYMSVHGQLNVATKMVMAGMIAIGLVDAIIDLVLRRVEAWIRSHW